MRSSSLVLLVVLAGCGPDVTAWKGTWKGSVVVTSGRAPDVYQGTLVVSDGGRFEVSAVSGGTSFSCALFATTADATTATFTVPTTCDLVATPADGCTRKVTLKAASATQNAQGVEGAANGRVDTACTGASTTAIDFALTFSGAR